VSAAAFSRPFTRLRAAVPSEGKTDRVFWDAYLLKDELIADIENVEQRLARAYADDDIERALIALERYVFSAAFAIRKLADSTSSSTPSRTASGTSN
jgi:hypothetical protein